MDVGTDYRRYGYAAPLVKKEPAQFSELRGGMTRAEGIRAGVVVCVWGFVSCVANGLVGAPWTELLMETACERQNITFGTPTCDSSEAAQAEATDRTSFLSIGQQLGGFLSIGLVSVLADARGRKPAMILITVGAATYPCAVWLLPSMGRVAFLPFEGFWLVLAVSVLGNLLGTAAFLSVSMSVMGDISAGLSPAARTNLFMALEAATWGGQMVGPLIGAKLAVRYGYKSPFMWATFACGAAILILLLFYRETLADAQRVKFDWARANPLGQLKPLVEHPVMIRFAIILGPTYLFAVCATQTITNLYLMRVAHADVVELSIVGVGGSLSQFVGAVGLVVLLPLLQKAGVGRAPIIVMALLSTVVQMSGWASLAYPSVQHFVGDKVFNALPYVINVIGFIVGCMMPCIRATIATLADSNEMQASVAVGLGAIAAEQTVFAMLAPAAIPALYRHTVESDPALSWWLACGLVVISLFVGLSLPNLERIGGGSGDGGARRSHTRRLAERNYRRNDGDYREDQYLHPSHPGEYDIQSDANYSELQG